MKLLLINTVDTNNPVELLFPPLGLAYVAAYLRDRIAGIDVVIITDQIEEKIRSFQPDLVGLSTVSQNYNLAKEYARICKSRGVPVIIGGTHISALPDTMTGDMDLAVIGEGEQTMAEIVNRFLAAGKRLDTCRELTGLAYRENGKLHLNPPRTEITPLDCIPFPARDLLTIPKQGIIHLFSSRGCPYRCNFCVSSRYWEKLRFFSAEYVLEEIDRVVAEYKPITIGFYDDLFIASKPRLIEIVEGLEKRGYGSKIEFVLNGRANLIDDDMAVLLKRMNVVAVNLGLESGSDSVLSYLKGEAATVETNRTALEVLHLHGINSHGTFIIGSPGETEEDILATEAFIRNSKLFSFDVYLLTPYPGTPVWQTALARGLVSEEMDWSRLIQEPHGRDPHKILFSDNVPVEKLFDYYLKFQKLNKIRLVVSRIRTVLHNPGRLFPAIRKHLATRLSFT